MASSWNGPRMAGWIGPEPVQPQALASVEAVLRAWEPVSGCAHGLQAGDLSWQQRFGLEAAASKLLTWDEGSDDSIAVVLCRLGEDALLAIDPRHCEHRDLANWVATWVADPTHGIDAVDGPPAPTGWRIALARRGFEATTDLYAHLWKPLSPADDRIVPGVVSTQDPAQIADRVAVRRSAFSNSTFIVERWRLLTGGAGFDPEFNLRVRDPDGWPCQLPPFDSLVQASAPAWNRWQRTHRFSERDMDAGCFKPASRLGRELGQTA